MLTVIVAVTGIWIGGVPGAQAVPSATVTFDANSGTGTMVAQTAATATALTSNAFTKTGNNFQKWNTSADGSGTSYIDGALYPFTSSTTLFAIWVSSGYPVVFNANGGTGAMGPQASPVAANLIANTFTYDSRSFLGWNTSRDGTGAGYADGGLFPFSIPSTLYAQWSAPVTHTVTFSANGGTGTMAAQVASAATALSANTFAKASYVFNNWTTDSDGTGTAYAAGASYAFLADITLYAQWTLATHSVTFNANSGSGSLATQTASSATALSTNTFTAPSNKIFNGWNTLANGSGTPYAGGATYSFAADITLYAQWTSTIAISFDANGGSGSLASQNFTINSSGTLSLNTLTRTGYLFYGWNTVALGGGTPYYDRASATFTLPTTLYAQWVALPGSSAGVIFNANGGTNTMVAQVASSPTALTTNGFSPPSGKTFLGWNTAANGSGTAYGPGQVYSFASSTTLYAQWGYLATFKSNYVGGGVDVTQVGFVAGTNLQANSFTRAGYVFVGWTTSASFTSSSTIYADSSSQTFTSAKTLYAQWVAGAPGEYAVVFFGNGGTTSGSATTTSQSGSTATALTLNAFSQPGYTFGGWSATSGGSTAAYADGATYAFTTSTTLYAIWNTNKVTFNTNGGTGGSTSSQSSTSDVTLTTNGFTRTSYVFNGWNTAADGSGVDYGQNATYPFGSANMSTTLYAQWTLVPVGSFYVMFLANGASGGTMSPQIGSSSTALTSNAFTKAGYSFGGWNTKADGTGSSYADGATFAFGSNLTVFAQWKPILTYKANYSGGGLDVTQIVTTPSSHTLLPIMYTRSGFVFTGWATSASGTLTYQNGQSGISSFNSPQSLYAQWVAVSAGQHVVMFWTSSPSTQVSAVSAALTTAPTTNSKTFLGWSTSPGGAVVYADKATYSFSADVVLYPITGPNIVTFDANGGTSGSMSPLTSSSSSKQLTLNAFARSGFRFTGWNTKADNTGTAYGDQGNYNFQNPNKTATLYAQWTATGVSVSFSANGGTGSMNALGVTSGSSLSLTPNQFAYVAKAFAGWNTAANGSGTSYDDGATIVPIVNVTLYAQWVTAASHQVTFDGNGGTGSMAPVTTSTGSALLPENTFSKTSAIFYGWNTAANGSGTAYADQSRLSVAADILLYAQYIDYSVGQVSISFNANGGTGVPIRALIGSTDATVAAPSNSFSKATYIFAGWNSAADGSGATTYQPGENLTFAAENTTYYAIWTQTWFTVTFDPNGGSGSPTTQTANTTANLQANAFTRTKYVFTGWNTAANGSGTSKVDSASFPFTSNLTLYAQWTQTIFTVTFDANGGTGAMADQASPTASTPLQSNTFTRAGYEFAGWATTSGGTSSYANGANYGFAADLALFAVWTPIYAVTFDPNGGTGSMSNQTGKSLTPLNLEAFVNTGYTFSGWNTLANGSGTTYRDGASYAFTASTTLYAQWTLFTYPVVFDKNGGTGSMATARIIGTALLPTNAFTRVGYTFLGWAQTPEVAQATYANQGSITVNSALTLYAIWKPDLHTVTYDAQGGSAVPSGTFVTDGDVTVASGPTRTGYSFAGWFVASSGGTALGATYSPGGIADITLYAQWTIDTYTVTYDAQGGSAASPVSHIYGSPALTLPATTRAGYSLVGWFTAASSGTNNGVNGVTFVPTSSVTLYAQWTPNSYSVTYNTQGGSSATGSTYTWGNSITLTSAPTRAGYTFSGWFEASSGGSVLSSTYAPSSPGNITFYAQWSANSYVVTYDPQGGSSVSPGSYTWGGSVSLASAPTLSGYTFTGWFVGSSGGSALSSPLTPGTPGDITLFAQWTPKSYAVTYDAQGGSSVSGGTYTWGGLVTLASASTRSGYTFTGWFTGTSGGSALTSPFTPASPGDITFYAQWSPNSYTVTYDANGGTGSPAGTTYATGGPSVVVADGGALVRPGYLFVTWNMASNGFGRSYAGGATLTTLSNVTLYALWQPIPVALAPTIPIESGPFPAAPSSPRTPEPVVTPTSPLGLPLALPAKITPAAGSKRTIDLGAGIDVPTPAVTPLEIAVTSASATRSLGQLQNESLGGFQQGSSVDIRVSGARTAGQFLMTSTTSPDNLSVVAALKESQSRTSADFAHIDDVSPVTTVDWSKVTTGKLTSDAHDLFVASGLGSPRTLADVPARSATHWISVNASASGYVPGSVVYLAVTTDPIIFGSAQVDKNGNVSLDGLLPIDVLEPAAHSIRIVGTRNLGGVSVDDNGNIQLTDSTMQQIQAFDQGTNAVVEISDSSGSGSHSAVRLVPLNQTTPWWLLWVYLGALLLALGIRRWKSQSKPAMLGLWITAVGGMAAVEVFAWVEFAYVMLPWAPIAAVIVLVIDSLIAGQRRGWSFSPRRALHS